MAAITYNRLQHVLLYDAETGVFTWRVKTCKKVVIGARAGNVDTKGRRTIRIDGVLYFSNRLAFFWMTGNWPSGIVDHKNLNPGDDAWTNLRDVTAQINQQNRHHAQCNNKLGFLGVFFHKRRSKFVAQIKAPGDTKNRYLGQFETAVLAHSAYLSAKRELHAGSTI